MRVYFLLEIIDQTIYQEKCRIRIVYVRGLVLYIYLFTCTANIKIDQDLLYQIYLLCSLQLPPCLVVTLILVIKADFANSSKQDLVRVS